MMKTNWSKFFSSTFNRIFTMAWWTQFWGYQEIQSSSEDVQFPSMKHTMPSNIFTKNQVDNHQCSKQMDRRWLSLEVQSWKIVTLNRLRKVLILSYWDLLQHPWREMLLKSLWIVIPIFSKSTLTLKHQNKVKSHMIMAMWK